MQKKVKVVIVALSVLLAISVLSLAGILISGYFWNPGPTTVVVPDNLISPDPKETQSDPAEGSDIEIPTPVPEAAPAEAQSAVAVVPLAAGQTVQPQTGDSSEKFAEALYLHSRNTGDNERFEVANMFPGDAETKYYCIQVRHKGDVTVRFRANIQPGYEKLAEVLKCRVVLLTTGQTLYDGLMRDMPAAVTHPLTATSSTTSELYYEITAYLETSVGNEYQLKPLIANFLWWVEEIENLEPPKTGDIGIMPFVITGAVSLFVIIALAGRRKKEDAENAR